MPTYIHSTSIPCVGGREALGRRRGLNIHYLCTYFCSFSIHIIQDAAQPVTRDRLPSIWKQLIPVIGYNTPWPDFILFYYWFCKRTDRKPLSWHGSSTDTYVHKKTPPALPWFSKDAPCAFRSRRKEKGDGWIHNDDGYSAAEKEKGG